jgi:hypothetical protein
MFFGNEKAGGVSDWTATFELFDDFNRPNSAIIGNGWTVESGQWSIESNKLKLAPTPHGRYFIVHPLPTLSTGYAVRLTETDINGNNGPYRFECPALINANADAGLNGYGVHPIRSDARYSHSGVNRYDYGFVDPGFNGIIDTQAPNFQFTDYLTVEYRILSDGSITGSVSDDIHTVIFNFGPRTITADGNYFKLMGEGSVSSSNFATFDDIRVRRTNAHALCRISSCSYCPYLDKDRITTFNKTRAEANGKNNRGEYRNHYDKG